MKVLVNSCIILVFISFAFLSCSKKELQLDDYCSYINSEESNFVFKKEINGVIYELKFRPNEFIILNEMHFKVENKNYFNSQLKSMESQKYFVLNIKDASGSNIVKKALLNKEEYGGILHEINSNLIASSMLLVDEKQIYPSIFNMDPPTSYRPEVNIIFTFDNIALNSQTNKFKGQFVFQDNLFKNGPIKFLFNFDDNNTPLLIL